MYSQNIEEQHIVENVPSGVNLLIDIGAYDGRTRSNSLALIERGWGGLLIEPSPKPFLSLLQLHGKNQDVNLFHGAVGLVSNIILFHPSDDGVSTSEPGHFQKWRETANFHPEIYCLQTTIDALMRQFTRLQIAQFVNIDTEGTSAALFRHFPFNLCRPKVFCVEADDQHDQLAVFADHEGYREVYRSNENLVLVRNG